MAENTLILRLSEGVLCYYGRVHFLNLRHITIYGWLTNWYPEILSVTSIFLSTCTGSTYLFKNGRNTMLQVTMFGFLHGCWGFGSGIKLPEQPLRGEGHNGNRIEKGAMPINPSLLSCGLPGPACPSRSLPKQILCAEWTACCENTRLLKACFEAEASTLLDCFALCHIFPWLNSPMNLLRPGLVLHKWLLAS